MPNPTTGEVDTGDASRPGAAAEPGPVPWPVWAAAAAAALLHAIPFLRMRLERPAPGQAWFGAPYIPEDWFAYLALVREVPRPGQLLLANPFTTDAQDGRFVLLFHHALNGIHRATGVDPLALLELARPALILVFAVVLFRFLEGFYASTRTRTWAVALALLSGGLGFAALGAARWLPERVGAVVRDDLWPMYGWTTYESLYNPLWVGGLALLLVALRPLVRPGAPAAGREVARSAAALLVLWLAHPYSAMAAVAIACAVAAIEGIASGAVPARRLKAIAIALVPLALVAGSVGAWQLRDEVFRRSTAGAFGAQVSSVFWYPVAWAAVGGFALVGARSWLAGAHPWRHAILGWSAGIALLHSSPVLSGYHFLPYAHLPIALLAAGPVARAFERLRGSARAGAGALALGVLLFAGTAADAASAFAKVATFQIPADYGEVLRSLAALPPGNVLCDQGLGNAVPAYGPHRVFVGHWFMTPDREARAALALQALGPGGAGVARRLVDSEQIDYVVAPVPAVPGLVAALADLAPRVEGHGSVAILRLRGR